MGDKFRPKQICNYFEKSGTCKYGANCRYLHEQEPGKEKKGKGRKKRVTPSQERSLKV